MESLDNRFTSQVDFKQPVKSNQKALQCDFCDHWTHLRCTTITVKEYHILTKCDDQYFCHLCNDRLPAFSDSFFLNTFIGNNNTVFDETLENTPNTPNSGVSKSGNPGPGPVPKTRAQIRIFFITSLLRH